MAFISITPVSGIGSMRTKNGDSVLHVAAARGLLFLLFVCCYYSLAFLQFFVV